MSGFGVCKMRHFVQRAIFSNEQCKLKHHLIYAYKNVRVKKSSPRPFLCNENIFYLHIKNLVGERSPLSALSLYPLFFALIVSLTTYSTQSDVFTGKS